MKRQRRSRKRLRAIAGGWGGNRLSTRRRYLGNVADEYRVPRQRAYRLLGPPAKHRRVFSVRYERQEAIAMMHWLPTSDENIVSRPAPKTRAAILSVIMFEIPSIQ